MTQTDYPDWQTPQEHANRIYATGVNAALPVQIGVTHGPFGPGALWGPFTVPFTVGAGYEILIFPVTSGNPFVTDVIVTHQDGAGTTVYVEEFCVSNFAAAAGFPTAPVIIRGNLHGPTLQIQGNCAASAFINTVTGGIVTASGVKVNVYALPSFIGRPRVASTPNFGDIAEFGLQTVGAGQDLIYSTLLSYSGPARFIIFSTTGGASSLLTRIQSFTVTNGTTSLIDNRLHNFTTNNEVAIGSICLDQYFHVVRNNNPSGVGANIVNMSLFPEDIV